MFSIQTSHINIFHNCQDVRKAFPLKHNVIYIFFR